MIFAIQEKTHSYLILSGIFGYIAAEADELCQKFHLRGWNIRSIVQEILLSAKVLKWSRFSVTCWLLVALHYYNYSAQDRSGHLDTRSHHPVIARQQAKQTC